MTSADSGVSVYDQLEIMTETVGGLLGALTDYGESLSHSATRIPAFLGAIASLGALSGRRWAITAEHRNDAITPPAMMLILLAESGAGKEGANSLMSAVSRYAGMLSNGAPTPWMSKKSTYASDIGLQSQLADCPVHLLFEDELARILSAAKKPGSPYFAVNTMLMDAYTKFGSEIPESKRRNDKDSIPAIHYPIISGVGATTPAAFHEILDRQTLDGGFLGRRIVVPMKPPKWYPDLVLRRGARPELDPESGLPPGVTEAMKRLWEFVRGGPCLAGCAPDERPDLSIRKLGVSARTEGGESKFMLRIMALDESVEQAEEEMLIRFHERAIEARGRGNGGGAAVLKRMGEAVIRLTGILALSDAAMGPEGALREVRYTAWHLKFAEDFVRLCMEDALPDLVEAASDNPQAQAEQRFLRVLDAHLKDRDKSFTAEGARWVRFRDVMRGANSRRGDINTKALNEAVTALEASDEIMTQMVNYPKTGPPREVRSQEPLKGPEPAGFRPSKLWR